MTRIARHLVVATLASLASLLAGCLSPLDLLGYESDVTESLAASAEPEDDKIEDKHPGYDPELTVVESFRGCEVTLNKSGSVTKLDIAPLAEGAEEATLDERLFRGRREAAAAVTALPGSDLIPSLEIVNGHLKPFNDGLYAAIEQDMQAGTRGAPDSKPAFLHELLAAVLAELPAATPAAQEALESGAVFVAAALLAGGATDLAIGADLRARAEAELQAFLANGRVARPIGFYTWNATLGDVFRQDRFAQNLYTDETPAEFARFAALAAVLAEDQSLSDRYARLVALYNGLTNPAASYTPLELVPYVGGVAALDDLTSAHASFLAEHGEPFVCTSAWYALFPASRSRDSGYFNSRWCRTSVPSDVNLIDELVAAISSGALDLAPAADSGWYDYQLWALETLLLPNLGPESDHLLLTADYKQKLIDTFKSIITQSRETHVKQAMGPAMGAADSAEFELYPLLPVEPFPTFYLRTARGYRFLAVYLQGVLGEGYLGQATRLREDGTAGPKSLAAELAQRIELAYGLYFLSAAAVGLDPAPQLLADELAEVDPAAAVARARTWLEGWREDADVLVDPRVIVPVAFDASTEEQVYWAVIGVKAVKITTEFVAGFEPQLVDTGGCELTEIVPHEYFLLVEDMQEVRIPASTPPPTRAELRAICDAHDRAADIVAALEAL